MLDYLHRKSIAGLAALAALLSGTAAADQPNYNYAELAYSGGNLEASGLAGDDQDTRGYKLEGSFALDEKILFRSSWLETDRNGSDWADVQVAAASVGWITEVNDDTSFNVNAQYRQDEIKARGLGGTQRYKGLGIVFELRSNVWRSLDLYGRGGYLLADYEGATSIDIGAIYGIGDLIGVSLSFS